MKTKITFLKISFLLSLFTMLFAFQSANAQYCTPIANCSYDDGFVDFAVAGISNSASGCSIGAYGDFTNMVTVLAPGTNYTLTVKSGYGSQYASVWIDFNDNQTFETSELVVTNFAFGTSSATTTMAIPSGAALGAHRMRAAAKYGSANSTSPCGPYSYGEFEDYTVIIGTSGTTTGAMAGVYTIAPSGGDYTTFNLAKSDLASRGVSGAVDFYVASGTYTEKVDFSNINGTAANTITFQSASGDSTDVILQYAPTSSSATECFTLRLNNSDYFRFENMTITTSSTGTYKRVVDITGGSDNNIFSNCQIIGGGNSSSSYNALFYSYTGYDHYNIIQNCYMKDGSYVRFYGGSGSNAEIGNQILNNVIDNCYYNIYAYYQDGIVIDGNTITNATGYGISAYYTKNNCFIRKNYISGAGSYGMYLRHNYYAPYSGSLEVSNNFISWDGSYAIRNYYSQDVNFYFNTINQTSTSTSSYGLYLAGSGTTYGGHVLKNNIISANGGYALYVNVASTTFTSDYNDFYTTGANLAYCTTGGDATTLSAWQSATSGDVNSFSVDPGFTSATDLHIMNSTLDSAATPIAAITTDIDGDLRNTTNPDIGADEFVIPVMSFVSSTTVQANTALAAIGSTNQEILGVEVVMNGAVSPQTATSFTFTTTGTTLASDIANAKLYYTANSNTFDVTTQVGSTVINPNGTFAITGSQVLTNGTNYFWLAYDISNTAVEDNFVDGTCTQIVIDATTHVPSVTSPTGNRKLTPFYYFEPFDVAGNWTATTTGSYAWTYSTDHDGDGTPSSGTGPANDHGNVAPWGFYFTEASNTGGPAYLTSPVFDFTDRVKAKFKFFYHMYGTAIGILHVDAYYDGVWHDDIMTPIVGQQHAAAATPWTEMVVNAGGVNGKNNVQFRFRAVSAGTYAGDISIDDIEITAKMPFDRDIEVASIDAMNTVSGNQSIDINFATYGTVNVTSAKFNYSVNGVLGTPFAYSGNLAQFSTVSSLSIGSPNIQVGTNVIKAWVTEINGLTDEDNENDTATYTFTVTTDAGIIAMDEASIQYGSSPVSAFIANYGTDLLTSSTVGWSINGITQTPASWTGSITSGNADGPVSLGNYTFGAGTYNLKIWTSSPNSITDIDATNDTLFKTFTFAVDAGISQIDAPGVIGTQNVVVYLKNFGSIPLTIANLKYQVNSGTIITYNWTGNLAPGAIEGPITIGTAAFSYGAQTIKAWSDSPNNGTDAVTSNDELTENFNITADIGIVGANLNPQGNCGRGNDTLSIEVQNFGTGPVSGPFTISYKEGTSTTITETVPASVTIQPGATYWHTFASLINLAVTGADSLFDVQIWTALAIDGNNFNDTISGQAESWYTPTAPTTTGATVAYGNSATLGATIINGDSLNWYDDPIGNNIVNYGATYTTPVLYDTTKYYVSAQAYGTPPPPVTAEIGTGTSTQGYPFYTYYMDSRTEMLYTAAELNAQGITSSELVNSIAFDISSNDTYTMNGFTIGMMNTSASTLTGFQNGFTTVYQSTYSMTSTGWTTFNLTTPFYWDGTSNIVIKICFDNTYYGSNSFVRSTYNVGKTWHYHFDGSTTSGCTTTGGSAYTYRPNIKLNITPLPAAQCESPRTPVTAIVTGIPSDAGISAINQVTETGTQNVNVTIENFTSVLLTGAGIDYEVNGTPGTTYTWNGNLAKNATESINIGTGTFVYGSNTIKAWSKLPNGSADPNPNNDTLLITFNIVSDIGVVAVYEPLEGCALGNQTVIIDIVNFGSDTAQAYAANFHIIGAASAITENITTPLAPGDTNHYAFTAPANLATTSDSLFEIWAYTTLASDVNYTNDSVFHTVWSGAIPAAPVGENDTINYSNSALLGATTVITGDTIFWYDMMTGGSSIHKGETYNTPALFDTTTYYAESATYNRPALVNTDATIGSGASTIYYVPIGVSSSTSFNNTWTVSIYTASEFIAAGGGKGILKGISYNKSSGAGYSGNHLEIYVKPTTATTVTSASWSSWTSGATKVYDNPSTVIPASNGWVDFMFNTGNNFNWDGTSNVLVIVKNHMPSTASGYNYWRYTSGDPGRYYFSSSNLADPTVSYGGTYRAQAKFNMDKEMLVLGCVSARTPIIAVVQNFPALDAGVLKVNGPISGPGKTNAEVLNITVKNFGTVSVDTIPVAYVLDAGTAVIDTVFASLNPGDTANFSFATTMDLSTLATYNVNVYSTLAGDVVTNNDAVNVQIIHSDYCISRATSTANGDIGNVTIKHPVTNADLLNKGIALPEFSNFLANKLYSDFTGLTPTILQQGQTYPTSVSQITGGSTRYGSSVGIWIDFNHDGILDAVTERVFTGSTTTGTTPGSLMLDNITIPADAQLGNTRMRVVINESPAQPCGTYGYGETEDYTVNIVPQVWAYAGLNDTICYLSSTTLVGSGTGPTYSWSSNDNAVSTTVSPTATTMYYLSVTDVYGFTGIDSTEVYVRDLPIAAASLSAVPISNFPATLNGSATGGFGTYKYEWSPTNMINGNSTNQTATTMGISTFQYFTLTVTDSMSNTACQDTAMVFVGYTGGPIAVNPTFTNDTVCKTTNDTLYANSSNGGPTHSWSWTSNPAGFTSNSENPIVNPTQDTWYIVEATDGANIDIDSVFVATWDLPTLIASDNDTMCIGDSVQITLNFTGEAPFSFNVFDGTNAFSDVSANALFTAYANPANTTNYVLTSLIDNNGCNISGNIDSIEVFVNPLPTPSYTGLSAAYCVDASDVTLIPSPTGGTFTGTGISGSVFSPATAGPGMHNLVYTYTDGNGCTDTTINSTIVNSLPVVSFSGLAAAYCIDDMATTLVGSSSVAPPMPTTYCSVASNNYTYEHFTNVSLNGATQTSIGSYYTDYSASTFTSLYTDSTYTISGTYLNDGGEYIFAFIDWNRSGTFDAGESVSIVTGSSGSETSFTANFTVPSTASIGMTKMRMIINWNSTPNGCTNPSYGEIEDYKIEVASPVGGVFTGLGINGNVFTPALAGAGSKVITYTYIDGNNCSNFATQSTMVNSLPTITVPTLSAVCIDEADFSLTGATPSGGTWSGTGVSSNVFSPATAGAGTFMLTFAVTDANTCYNSDSTSILVNALPVLTLPTLSGKCVDAANFALIGASPSAGTWSGTGVSANSFSPATAGVGTFMLTYSFTDANTCTNLDSTAQVVNGLPVLSVTGLNSGYCVDASAATLTATPSGGTFFGPGLSGNVFTPSVAGAGVYGLLYYYTDANGCFSSTSLPTEVYALPVVSFTGLNAGYCLDAAAATLTPSPAGGTFTGAGMAANVFSPSVAGVGTTSILYSYTDGNSCTNSASIPTEVYGLPTVTLRTDTTICAVNNTVLDAGTFTSYLWNTGAITQSITVDTTNYGIGAFNYSVIVGDIHNCTATDSVEITYEATPVSMLTDSATICGEDASLILDAGANALYTYLWNDASTTSSITVDSAIIGGLMNYMYVTISSPAGCTESDSTHVYFRAVPMPNVGNDTTICWTQNIVFDAGAGYTSYLWSNGAITQTISLDSLTFALGANDYSVEVYNDVNCNNSDTITLIIDPCTGILTPEIIGADILVYPNPTKGQFQIDISGLENQDYNLGIFNSFGSQIFADQIQSSGQSTQSWIIDLSTYAKGIYFIRLQSKDQIKVQRIIIQ